MKIFILSLLTLFFVNSLFAKEIKIKSKIDKVTVFRSGAQIHRKANTYLQAGRSEIVFSKLAMSLNAESIQVSGKGAYTILAVYHRLNYLDRIKQTKRIREMQDSVKLLAKKINYINSDISVYQEEVSLIKANRVFGSPQVGYKVSELEAAANFYRKRLKFIYDSMLDLKYKKQDLNTKKAKLQNQINVLSRATQKALSEIVIEVIADNATNASIKVSYVVNNAGWNPEYDIRAIDINKPIELHARALIQQNTGIDWKNVKLTISTGNPNRSGVIPTLFTWYLNYRDVSNKSKVLRRSSSGYVNQQNVGGYDVQVTESAEPRMAKSLYQNASNSSNFTQAVQGQTNVKYEISIPYNITSSGKITGVKIQKFELYATYRYYCVPKLDEDVFLQARITGWEELNLVPGNVNIFFEGTYVSKSFLNPNTFIDTLDISLGRDKSIIVKREKIKDKNKKSFMGGKNKIQRSWEISVRNTKSKDIHLFIEDQIPRSRNKEIEVELSDKSGAKHDPVTGKLKWEFDLKPKTTKKLTFSYAVKYPKNYYLTNME